MTRKILAVVLALAMVFALALTACGNEAADAEDTKAADTTAADTTAKEEETTAADTEEEEFALETVDWYCAQDMNEKPDWADYVWPELQAYFLETLNLEVEWHGFAWADYAAKFQAALTANTGIDLMYMAATGTPLGVWYERNALCPLDDLLNKYAPELVASMPEYAFKACTIDGQIYGMPTVKDLQFDTGYMYNATLMEELGLNDSFEAVDFQNAKDLSDFFYEAQTARNEAHGDWADYPLNSDFRNLTAYFKCDSFTSGLAARIDGTRCFEDQDLDGCFLMYETDEYANNMKMLKQWTDDNITPYDCTNYQYTDIRNEGILLGQFELGLIVAVRDQYAEYGWTQELRHPNFAYTSTGACQGSYTSINGNTTPEKQVGAMRLWNCVAEDSYAATVIRFGLEDIHWQKYTDDNGNTRIDFDFEGSRNGDPTAYNYYMWYFHQIGDLTSVWLPDTQGDNFVEFLKEMNNNALSSQYMGFNLATEAVQNEIAACATVLGEYETDLYCGMIDDVDGRIDAFVAALEANGIRAIQDETNAQLADFVG